MILYQFNRIHLFTLEVSVILLSVANIVSPRSAFSGFTHRKQDPNSSITDFVDGFGQGLSKWSFIDPNPDCVSVGQTYWQAWTEASN